MEYLNNLNDLFINLKENQEYVVCCPKEYKDYLLIEMNKQPFKYNFSFITINDLIKKLTFSFDENAIYYLMDKYHYSYDIAITYLNNLFFANLIKDDNLKVKKLQDIYKELEFNNLLMFDNFYQTSLKQKDILIIGYKDIKKEYLSVLDKYNYQLYCFNAIVSNKKIVYQCENIDDELHLLLDNISSLINEGVPLDKIKIMGITNIERAKLYFSLYNIPIHFNKRDTILNYPIFNFNKYINVIEFNEYLESLDIKKLSICELNLYKKVINCLNGIYLDGKDKLDIVSTIVFRKLKEIEIEEEKYDNAVELINFDGYFDYSIYQDQYLFICGLNEGLIPSIVKDEDYFKDQLKYNNNITTSYDINNHNKKSLKQLILNSKNIYLSYLEFNNTLLYPSNIINDLNLNVFKYNSNYSLYSNKFNKIKLIKDLDLLTKYGNQINGILELYNTYKLDDYLKYDNNFKVLNKDNYINELSSNFKEKIKLSYSSMDVYNRCPFAYYVENIIKVNKFESSFPLFIGNLYHYVLEKVFSNNMYDESNFNHFINEYLAFNNEYKLFEITNREEVLLIKLIDELKNIIEVIKNQQQWITYNKTNFEKKISIINDYKFNDLKTIKEFNGVIDKLFFKEIEEDGRIITYVTLIDYKTGNTSIKIDLVEYGLSMQLPVYIYLIKESKLFENVRIGGIFIQNILSKDYKTKKASYEEMEIEYSKERNDSLKLDGYLAFDNCNFDKTDNDSLIIKGLKKKKDGNFAHYSKVLSTEQIDDLYLKSKKIINKTYNSILNGDFRIEPKVIDKKYNSCEYCKYNDLCFKSYKNIKFITLRGDDND